MTTKYRGLATGIVTLGLAFGVLLWTRTDARAPEGPAEAPQRPQEAVLDAGGILAPSEEAGPSEPSWRLLYSFTTRFKSGPKYEGRSTNIRLLAEKLDGTVLEPSQEFSFNKAVGPRTKEAGFKEAPTYFLGEVLPGLGGGTCQVSSTLYAAVLHVNVEVTDRRPHSRPSSYIKPGLDATVNYPEECWKTDKPDQRVCYDLQFRNPYDFPLKLRFKIGELEEGKRPLTVEVHGTGLIPKVTTEWRPYSSEPFTTRYRRVSWWKDDRKKLSQSGQNGIRGARLITVEYPDGRKETRKVYSKYQPVPEVWEVGMDFEKPEEAIEKPDGGV